MALARVCSFCLEPERECVCEIETPPAAPPPLDCRTCGDTGHVCPRHPSRPWGLLCCEPDPEPELPPGGEVLCEHGACHCWATRPVELSAGIPCPDCRPPVASEGARA